MEKYKHFKALALEVADPSAKLQKSDRESGTLAVQGNKKIPRAPVITATTHATVFENDGLATKVLSSHIGGVVRLSLDARGALTVTEGLVSGLFSGQPVPSLDSAESTRSFVSSLLEKQGLRGL